MKTSITSGAPAEITTGQVRQVSRFVSDASGKATEEAIEHLVKAGQINRESLQRVITRGGELTNAVSEFVRKKVLELATAVKQIPVWIKVRVGGVAKADLVSGLGRVSAGDMGLTFRISDYAKVLTSKSTCVVSETAEDAEFATATPEDLGFKVNPTTDEFFDEKNLAKYGLELCKPDDPYFLRKVYTDQPDGEWLPIGMKFIRDSDGDWGVFNLDRHGSELWLSGRSFASPQRRLSFRRRVVFRVRKNRS